ncbi:MAG: TlpA disulfide reductase family protein [Thermoanaerobaculia bacterium]
MPIRRSALRRCLAFAAVACATVPGLDLAVATPPPPIPAAAPAAPAAPAPPDLVRIVRGKIAAGDLASAEAWTEDWKRDRGVDPTYLDARGWVARGAWLMGEYDRALAVAAEVRAAIPAPTSDLLIPLGAALEVEGRIRAQREGAAAGVLFFRDAAERSPDPAFRARMWKNVNRLELVGKQAPELAGTALAGGPPPSLAARRGHPVLLFFWAHGCGDCRASAPTLARIRERFAARGLELVAPTRLFGSGSEDTVLTPEAERAEIARVLSESYAALPNLPVAIDTETFVRYGASSTPTFVLVDRDGIVRLYAPTRLTESALAAAIEPLLAPGS